MERREISSIFEWALCPCFQPVLIGKTVLGIQLRYGLYHIRWGFFLETKNQRRTQMKKDMDIF